MDVLSANRARHGRDEHDEHVDEDERADNRHDLALGRQTVDAKRENAMRVQKLQDVVAKSLGEDRPSDDLDAAGRRTGTAANEKEE